MSHTSQPVFDPNEVVVFSDSMMQQMNEVVKKFPQDKEKSALIQILHIAQAEYGWLSVPVMNKIADFLKIQAIEVYEVATFYTMFHLQPVGKHVLEVCRTGPCMLVGSDQLIEHMEKKTRYQGWGNYVRRHVYPKNGRMPRRLWIWSLTPM